MDSYDLIFLIPIYLTSAVLGYGDGARLASKANEDAQKQAVAKMIEVENRHKEFTQRSNEEMTNLRKDIVAQRKIIDGHAWRSIDSAPLDGTIVNVMGRYVDATAGFPRYAGFYEGQWHEFTRHPPEPLVCWAWRPRDWSVEVKP